MPDEECPDPSHFIEDVFSRIYVESGPSNAPQEATYEHVPSARSHHQAKMFEFNSYLETTLRDVKNDV